MERTGPVVLCVSGVWGRWGSPFRICAWVLLGQHGVFGKPLVSVQHCMGDLV